MCYKSYAVFSRIIHTDTILRVWPVLKQGMGWMVSRISLHKIQPEDQVEILVKA
jgi:hypothetical protein